MIKMFGRTDTSFGSNGDIVIQPLKAKVRKEDNGDYYLDIEAGLKYLDYFIEGNVVVVDTPQGAQGFRLRNIQKTKSKIVVRAYHVFYDSENYLIADSNVVDKDCNDALDHLNSATDTTSPFYTISNITTINSYRCVRKSLFEAIKTILERWGGHLVRDNFTIRIMSEIGVDNGVTVRYGKNLKDITCEENWDNVVTKLLPVGKNGLLLNGEGEGSVYVDPDIDIYVYSDFQYDLPYTKTVTFNQDDILEENYTDEEGNFDALAYQLALMDDLKVQANDYVNINCYPKANYTLKANLERITDVGDTVLVIDDRLGINVTTSVISFEYDCILEKYTEIEFGNFSKTLSGLLDHMIETAEKIASEKIEGSTFTLEKELKAATAQIWGALGNSYVIYDGDKILVVDTLPKENARNVMMINSGGIGFSTTGINGTFNSAWTIDGTLNMQAINVINMTANLIKGGTLKLGSRQNQSGRLELYDEANNLIGEMTKDGLKMYGSDGSYVLINNAEGFAGYDSAGNKIYWVARDEFHMNKSVIEEEITLCEQLRFISIERTETDPDTGEVEIVNQGIGLVSSADGEV